MLTNRRVVLLKIESTPGVEEVPSPATDAILVEDLSWNHESVRMVERNVVKHTLGKMQSIHAGNLKSVAFSVEIKGSGVAGTAPEMGQALRACGLSETIVASTSVAYAPVSTGHEYATLYDYDDGQLHVIVGSLGDASFNAEGGSTGKISFTFTGHDERVVDEPLVTPSYDATVPPPFINASFDIGGYAASISSLSMDLGNSISQPTDASAVDGFGQLQLTDRDIAGSFDPLQALLAQKNFIEEWKTNVRQSMTTGVVGSAAGNRWELSQSAIAFREVGNGDREGLMTYDMSYGAHETAGDDQFSLVFT